jgi:hypothetical protein
MMLAQKTCKFYIGGSFEVLMSDGLDWPCKQTIYDLENPTTTNGSFGPTNTQQPPHYCHDNAASATKNGGDSRD